MGLLPEVPHLYPRARQVVAPDVLPLKHGQRSHRATLPNFPTNFIMTQEALNDKLAQLGRIIFTKVTEMVQEDQADEVCEEIMEHAEKLGLAKLELFDPEIHGHDINAEPGEDIIWTWHFLPKNWQQLYHNAD